jgi:hypothetical protein
MATHEEVWACRLPKLPSEAEKQRVRSEVKRNRRSKGDS